MRRAEHVGRNVCIYIVYRATECALGGVCVGKGTLAADGMAMCVLKRRVMAGAPIEMVLFARPVCFAAPPPQSRRAIDVRHNRVHEWRTIAVHG